MVASSPKDSKEQSSSLTVKSDGIYLNGALLFNNDNAGNGDSSGLLDNMANGTTGNKNWDDFQKGVIQAAKEAQEAADEAKKAGEQAKQAGLDASAAGQKAETLAKDTQNKIAYYLSISDNADVYVPLIKALVPDVPCSCLTLLANAYGLTLYVSPASINICA